MLVVLVLIQTNVSESGSVHSQLVESSPYFFVASAIAKCIDVFRDGRSLFSRDPN